MVKVLENSQKQRDTKAEKYKRGEQNCSKPKLIRKFNEKNRSW